MTNKPTKRPINGVLLLDNRRPFQQHRSAKSATLVPCRKSRAYRRTRSFGHRASACLLGEATKFAQLSVDADKAYTATLKLGEASSTGDAEGEIIATARADISLSEFQTPAKR